MKSKLRYLIPILVGYVGLHLPRSYVVLYVVALLAFVIASRQPSRDAQLLHDSLVVRPGWNFSILLCALFSITFVFGFLCWGFWSWENNRADIINALLLPPMLFWAGTRLGSCGRNVNTAVLATYSLGGLVYVLLALAISRLPWWDISQVFSAALSVPWGNPDPVNVRSVEQNAFASLLMLAPASTLLLKRSSILGKLFAIALLVCSILGAHIIWSLDGRLGWLALILCLAPSFVFLFSRVPMIGSRFFSRSSLGLRVVTFSSLVVSAVASLSLISKIMPLRNYSQIWTQGFCDERFSMYTAMLQKLYEAPFGGRLLEVTYASCIDDLPLTLGGNDASIAAVHNVPLEIYYSVGVIPFFLLFAFLAAPLTCCIRSFLNTPPYADWQRAMRWSWMCLLLCQWAFQPLLYSDGLLYYFSFMVLGVFAQECRLDRLTGLRLMEYS